MRVLNACANPAACNSGERNHATPLADSTNHESNSVDNDLPCTANFIKKPPRSQTQPLLLGFKLRLLALVGGVNRRAILNGLNFKAR